MTKLKRIFNHQVTQDRLHSQLWLSSGVFMTENSQPARWILTACDGPIGGLPQGPHSLPDPDLPVAADQSQLNTHKNTLPRTRGAPVSLHAPRSPLALSLQIHTHVRHIRTRHTYARAHTYTHAHMHTHTHIHTYTHTQTHTTFFTHGPFYSLIAGTCLILKN